MADTTSLKASCHCGAVQLEMDHKPKSLTECTCSSCHRYGVRHAYYTRQTARVLSSPDAMQAYIWGDKSIEFYHCKTCGCMTHYESVEKNQDSRIAVNARMIDPQEVKDIPIRLFDGASTWQYID